MTEEIKEPNAAASLAQVDDAAIDEAIGEMENAMEGEQEDQEVQPYTPNIEEESEEADETEQQATDDKNYTDEEIAAMSKGWRPKDQYDSDEKEWKSAKEFLKDGEYIDTIKSQGQRIKSMEKAVKALVSMNKKQYDDLHQEKAAKLIEMKREAIQNGDVESVETIDKSLGDLQEEVKKTAAQIPDVALDFANRNKDWFNDLTRENSEMKEYAIKIENQIRGLYPGWSDEEILNKVEMSTKKYFNKSVQKPNVNRNKASAVTMTPAENASLKKSNKITFKQLPSSAKNVVREMMRFVPDDKGGKALTYDDYAQQLKDSGVI